MSLASYDRHRDRMTMLIRSRLQDQFKNLGEEAEKLRVGQMKEQLSVFKSNLETFARKHKVCATNTDTDRHRELLLLSCENRINEYYLFVIAKNLGTSLHIHILVSPLHFSVPSVSFSVLQALSILRNLDISHTCTRWPLLDCKLPSDNIQKRLLCRSMGLPCKLTIVWWATCLTERHQEGPGFSSAISFHVFQMRSRSPRIQ